MNLRICGAVFGEDFLEGIDLVVALLDLILGRELAHPADQHVLVMRAVEDADEAAARRGDMRAPEEIVRQFFLARLLERGDDDAERAGLLEDVLDGAVLAGGVDALQHHQQRALAFGVEPVLQLVDGRAVLDALLLGGLAVGEGFDVGRIAAVEMRALARFDAKSCGEGFWPSRYRSRSLNSGCRLMIGGDERAARLRP